MSTNDLPPGQGPIDPRGAFGPVPEPGRATPPPLPPNGGAAAAGAYGGYMPPPSLPPGWTPQPMPMMYPPPAAPVRERSLSKALLITAATSIFGLSLMANVWLLITIGLMSGGAERSDVLVDGDLKQKVAVVPVEGVIDGKVADDFARTLRDLQEDATVRALVVEVDTPGGEVTASDEIYDRLRRFKEARNIPVVVSMGSMATSGGYYVACAGDHVFAQPTTMTGNIGVLMPRFNVSKLAEKWGVEEKTLHSTGADFKDAGSMFRPENPAETKYIQALIDDAFGRFKHVVAEGRGEKLKEKEQTVEAVANGKVFVATEAQKLGLVDAIGYPSDAYAHAASAAGLSHPTVLRYERKPGLMDLLSAKANFGAAQAGVTVNGVNVNLDRTLIDNLTTPRLMYLWRGE